MVIYVFIMLFVDKLLQYLKVPTYRQEQGTLFKKITVWKTQGILHFGEI